MWGRGGRVEWRYPRQYHGNACSLTGVPPEGVGDVSLNDMHVHAVA